MTTHCPTPVRHGPKDPLEVDLVVIATFTVECVGIDLPRQQEHRHRVRPAFGNPRQGIGCPGTGGRTHNPGPAGHPAYPSAANAPACSLRIRVVPINPDRLIAS